MTLWQTTGLALVVLVVALGFDYAARQRWWRLGGWTRRVWRHRPFCIACKTSSRYARLHRTRYYRVAINGSPFVASLEPLCERCWAERSPVERLPFYEEAWLSELSLLRSMGLTPPPHALDQIRAAVTVGQ